MTLDRSIFAIVDANQNASQIRGLGSNHALPILPVLSRYRLVDFAFSNLVNASIDPVYLVIDKPNRHIFNYIGSGSNWNLHRKNRGLNYLFTTKDQIGTGNNLGVLYKSKEHISKLNRNYVLYTNIKTINRIDYKQMYELLIQSNADIVWAYRTQTTDSTMLGSEILKVNKKSQRVLNFGINSTVNEAKNLNLGIFMMPKDLYIRMLDEAVEVNLNTRIETFLQSKVNDLKIVGYQVPTWIGFLNSVEDYFTNQIYALLDANITKEVFTKTPLYTQENDQISSFYGKTAKVRHCLLGSGCHITGTVKNSILFRGVTVKPGAEVENCIVLNNVVIGENVKLKNIIIDDNALITDGKILIASEKSPLVVFKNSQI